MVVTEKLGNLKNIEINNKFVDYLPVAWYETNKRILHKKTVSGKEIVLKFLNQQPQLTQGDILFIDINTIIAIDILACEVLIIKPKSWIETANICYEIGNKHLPLFYDGEDLLVGEDLPLLKLLQTSGYDVQKGKRKLINPLKTTVAPHGSSSDSLFSKIMKLTTTA
jgi:urease accessory protein